jgi:thioesterase DpgC
MAIAIGDDVGLPRVELERLGEIEPGWGQSYEADARAASRFLLAGQALVDRLPPRPERSAKEQTAAETLQSQLRTTRVAFLRRHAARLYAQLTDERHTFLRVEDLVYRAANVVPGLVPSREQVMRDRQRLQKDKEGYEVDQGLFLSYVLSDPLGGRHLLHAMLRPLAESLAALPTFQSTGRFEIGNTTVERAGSVGYVYHGNPRFLNAEDDSTTRTLEIATDLALLDPEIEVVVLRGKTVDHPKYRGRRVFNAGVNLTHLYQGQISFVDFFMVRDMGFVHKMYRGLSGPEFWPDEVEATEEKPWIAAVETFAIGGGCQILLAMDYVLAERGSFFNLPARKEGIVPGVANMRLWRFVGDRTARQAVLFERGFPAESPAGQLVCDRVVPDGEMDVALAETLSALSGSGVVSASGNRKALRIGQEPIDLFCQYLAVYAREQAYCHYSPQLIRNLERNWNAAERTL